MATPDVMNTARPASERSSGVHGANELPVRGDVDRDRHCPRLSARCVERRGTLPSAGIADKNVEPPVALVEAAASRYEPAKSRDVERRQRGRTAGCADRVVELFETADRARERDHMRAGARQHECGGAADAARGAGDERDPTEQGGKRDSSARLGEQRELRCGASSPSTSVRWVGIIAGEAMVGELRARRVAPGSPIAR